MDSCICRLERLIPDDKFDKAEEAERPSPTTNVKNQMGDIPGAEEA